MAIVLNADSDTAPFEDALDGFRYLTWYQGAARALQSLEDSQAHVVILLQDMVDMPGLELAESLREFDEEYERTRYIILCGTKLTPEIGAAFKHIIDAFIPLDQLSLLRHYAMAGCRLAPQMNFFRHENKQLKERSKLLEAEQLVDSLTGLGNRRFTEQALFDVGRQVESRGGAVCMLMIGVENYPEVIHDYDKAVADQLIVAVSKKLQQLVRPLDAANYFEPGVFALVLIQPSIEHCTAECYRRIFDGVHNKSYPTSAGFLSATVRMSICASGAEMGPPNTKQMIRSTKRNLENTSDDAPIAVEHLNG